MNFFLFLGGIFLFSFLVGILLEKIRIPWIFSALILGFGGSFYSPFKEIADNKTFIFLAWLGMYFLLFLIGFELEIEKIKELGKFIVKSTFFIIFFEALFGTLLVHFIFKSSWLVSVLVGLSFATVGEAVLIPILDDFKLIKTKLGQLILGIGTFDDIIEVLLIIIIALLIPFFFGVKKTIFNFNEILLIIGSILVLFLFSFGILKLKRRVSLMRVKKVEAIFILVLAIFFLFLGIGSLTETAALGALLAGLTAKNFLPEKRLKEIEDDIKSLTYGFFGPIFFFWVGLDTNFHYLISHFWLVFLVIIVTSLAKIVASYLVGKDKIGLKPSLFMGVALGVRFSTSIVIIKFLFEEKLIGIKLYSVLIGASAGFVILIPFLLSFLANKWRPSLQKEF